MFLSQQAQKKVEWAARPLEIRTQVYLAGFKAVRRGLENIRSIHGSRPGCHRRKKKEDQ